MRTRYGKSPWVDQFPATRRLSLPRLRGEHVADVVVIGGGLTGCATAYAMAAAGFNTMLLERDRIGQGSAGRSAGLLTPEPGPSFREVAAAHGIRTARHVFGAWRRGALDAAALLRRLGIKCDLSPRDSILVAGPGDDKRLRRDYNAVVDETDLKVAWLTDRQMRRMLKVDAAGGVRTRDVFAIDPYKAGVGLARAAMKRGAACFERTHVKKVRFTRTHVDVVTDGGTVRAGQVVVTTGVATREFASLQRHIKRREGYFALTEPVPAAMRRQLLDRGAVVRDTGTPSRSVLWTAGGRLLLAGGDQAPTSVQKRPSVLVQRTGQLMYELLTTYPAISGLQPEYGWEASYGVTADGLMYIGAHRNFPRHLFALGGPRDSVTGAFVAARMLLRALQGEPEKADLPFGWTR